MSGGIRGLQTRREAVHLSLVGSTPTLSATFVFHAGVREAVRGEGRRLLLLVGSPFMQRFDPRAEPALGDIVARAIDHEINRLEKPWSVPDVPQTRRIWSFPGSNYMSSVAVGEEYGQFGLVVAGA